MKTLLLLLGDVTCVVIGITFLAVLLFICFEAWDVIVDGVKDRVERWKS